MNYYFITGSSSGIGKAMIAYLIGFTGNKVYGISRSNHLTDDQYTHYTLDLSDKDQLLTFNFPDIKDAKKIVLINNAGTLGDIKYMGNLSNENIYGTIQVNFTASAILCNKFLKSYGSMPIEKVLINITSGAANTPYDGWSTYCSSKAAINMLTEVLAEEQQMQTYPTKCFAIAPGVVDTYMQDTIRKVDKSNFKNIEKFKKLKSEGQLYKASMVAEKIIEFARNPQSIPSTIYRVKL